jgi:hypothetical protein
VVTVRIFILHSAVLMFICTGDVGVGTSLHQDMRGLTSAEVTDEEDKMILEYLQTFLVSDCFC